MLFCVCSHTLSEIAFLLFERKILVGLEIRCKKRSPFGKCVFNLGVESTVLRVTPGTEASQAMAGSFCAQNKNKKNAEIQKDRPHTGKHSPQPKATGRLSIPVVQQSLERERGKHVYFQQEAVHTPPHVRDAGLPDGDMCSVNTGERALSPSGWQAVVSWQPALGTE